MKKLTSWIKTILHPDSSNFSDEELHDKVILSNMIAIVSAGIALTFFTIYLSLGLIFQSVLFLSSLLSLLLVPYLNFRHYYLHSRILLGFIGISSIIIIDIFTKNGAFLLYLFSTIAPLMLFSNEEKIWIKAFFIYNFFGIGLSVIFNFFPIIPQIDSVQPLRTSFIIVHFIFTLLLNLGLIYVFNRQTQRLKKRLKVERDRANTANLAKSTFVANMSHEIRTPLNGMIGTTQLLEKTNLSTQQQKYLNRIQSSGDILHRVIDDVLDFSKISAGKLALEKSKFDLIEAIDTVQSILEERLSAAGLEFLIEIDDELPVHVIGDKLRLQQILINLIGNSIKFTEQGQIQLHVQVENSDRGKAVVVFHIIDTGIGIKPEHQANLFQSFTQSDDSIAARFGGTGLGLTISKNLVELMNGNIDFASQWGKGTTFIFSVVFELPQDSVTRYQSYQKPVSHQPVDPEGFGHLKGSRILLVDDNITNQELVQEMLGLEGLDVCVANHGKEAVERVDAENFQLILMDLQMPVMDGITACQRIRTKKTAEELPIIALSANAVKEEMARCISEGMQDYIVKPVDIQTLFDSINKWILKVPNGIQVSEIPGDVLPRPKVDYSDLERYGINVTAALNRFKKKPHIYQTLLITFFENYSTMCQMLKGLIANHEHKKLELLIHSTRSNASSLGAEKLAMIATDFETALQNDRVDTYPAYFRSYEEELTAMLKVIQPTVEELRRLKKLPVEN